MSGKTGIQWTDATWNPIVGCSIASPGCARCYAAREAAGRLSHLPLYEGLAVRSPTTGEAEFTGEVRVAQDRILQPLRWQKPRMVFVNSMSDLFHPNVPRETIVEIVAVMASATVHSFQVLTKRPKRLRTLLDDPAFRNSVSGYAYHLGGRDVVWPVPNIWWGVSIENDDYTWRADQLSATDAAVRFVSAEPLLGPLPSLNLHRIDWLIVGAESGPRARPMSNDWVRDLRDRCGQTGPAFFVKQLSGGQRPIKNLDEFPPDLRIRDYPA